MVKYQWRASQADDDQFDSRYWVLSRGWRRRCFWYRRILLLFCHWSQTTSTWSLAASRPSLQSFWERASLPHSCEMCLVYQLHAQQCRLCKYYGDKHCRQGNFHKCSVYQLSLEELFHFFRAIPVKGCVRTLNTTGMGTLVLFPYFSLSGKLAAANIWHLGPCSNFFLFFSARRETHREMHNHTKAWLIMTNLIVDPECCHGGSSVGVSDTIVSSSRFQPLTRKHKNWSHSALTLTLNPTL